MKVFSCTVFNGLYTGFMYFFFTLSEVHGSNSVLQKALTASPEALVRPGDRHTPWKNRGAENGNLSG